MTLASSDDANHACQAASFCPSFKCQKYKRNEKFLIKCIPLCQTQLKNLEENFIYKKDIK